MDGWITFPSDCVSFLFIMYYYLTKSKFYTSLEVTFVNVNLYLCKTRIIGHRSLRADEVCPPGGQTHVFPAMRHGRELRLVGSLQDPKRIPRLANGNPKAPQIHRENPKRGHWRFPPSHPQTLVGMAHVPHVSSLTKPAVTWSSSAVLSETRLSVSPRVGKSIPAWASERDHPSVEQIHNKYPLIQRPLHSDNRKAASPGSGDHLWPSLPN